MLKTNQLLTADGRSGTILLVASLAAVVLKQEQEPAQVHLHNMAGKRVKEMQNKPKAVMKNRVVSRIINVIKWIKKWNYTRLIKIYLCAIIWRYSEVKVGY